MTFETIIEIAARSLEAMGIAVVCTGGIAATVNVGRRLVAGDAFEPEGSILRERLARATLLGLEFLVAADIIATVAAVPTPARLLMLTGIILLRTFLSATLTVEVDGRWPWSAPSFPARRGNGLSPIRAHEDTQNGEAHEGLYQ
jgi:uncharacterized membrane protein